MGKLLKEYVLTLTVPALLLFALFGWATRWQNLYYGTYVAVWYMFIFSGTSISVLLLSLIDYYFERARKYSWMFFIPLLLVCLFGTYRLFDILNISGIIISFYE